MEERDFTYDVLEGQERDEIILSVLKKIDADTQVVGARERRDVWQEGWAENLKQFTNSGGDPAALVPRFLREGQVVRYAGQYVRPANHQFELDFITVFRTWLFQKHLAGYDAVYEFGCGTGFNLVLIANLLPGKELHGLDFVQSSVDLVNRIAEHSSYTLKGHLFDMLSPDPGIELGPRSAVFTFGAVEQLAGRFEPFLEFLLHKRPGLCIHVEPTIELYDPDSLFDYLAVKFLTKRGYTHSFLPRLEQLADQGLLDLMQVKRLHFGSLYMEGYMYYVWKPL